jgi:hypothetical protein
MVQCSELGMHSIGIDISAFNCLISNGKVGKYDLVELENILKKITENFEAFCEKNEHIKSFDIELQQELTAFNTLYFPAPEYRYKVKRGEIDEAGYAKEKEVEFKKRYEDLRTRYHITLQQEKTDSFLGKRYINTIRQEIDFLVYEVERIQDENIKNIVRIILSRTVRSCRATTHSDLATLKDPVLTTYYCSKHGKICKPLFSMFSRWVRYSKDTIKRVKEFDSLRTASHQICLQGDSRTLDIKKELKRLKHPLEHILEQQKIKGIFSSPPYVGLIDYHEQHAYAYELFNLERCDESEI